MKAVDFTSIKINGGFWKEKQDLVREITINAVYDRFKESGRIDAFNFDSGVKAHFFWDSDVAKWIESVAYLSTEKREPALEAIVDEIVDNIEKYRDECGYFNIYHMTIEPENRLKIRDHHELYCLGHLIEAGVAYYKATGKDKLLKLMCDYTDYVEKRFKIDKNTPFTTPGHEEIELALVKLYDVTGEKRYLELSRFFVDERGTKSEELCDWMGRSYNQSHAPVREQDTAEGHAVRAVYLYCAMADLALKYNDEALKNACRKIFDNIISKRMYITGGIGSCAFGEAFTVDYDLPNLTAYTESCAAIGLAFFAHRMLLLENDAKYADTIERVIYNGFLSSFSLDGDKFFYCNPLEILPYMLTKDTSQNEKNTLHLPVTRRQKEFECSCCPPNITRFVPTIANFMYTCDDDTIYVHQYMQSEAKINLGNRCITIEQKTLYPTNGKIEIKVSAPCKLAVRIPFYCRGEGENGYKIFEITDPSSPICLDFDLTPRFVCANPEVLADADKIALVRGPVVYCMESVDNEGHLRSIVLDTSSQITESENAELGVIALTLDAYQRKPIVSLYSTKINDTYKTKATLIPFYAFANREECEMQVWHNYR